MPRKRPQRSSSNLRLRVAIFAILTLALAGGSAYALWPKELPVIESTASDPMAGHTGPEHGATGHPATVEADLTLRIDMGGFTPPSFTIPANRLVRVKIVNPDSSHHSDGGGIHQFAIDKLGVDAKVQPETIQIVTIPPTAEGEYSFYCDTCCGGKQNPTMQGVLKVKA